MLAALIAGLIVTVLYLALAPRKYRSEAKLLVRMGRESMTIDPTATTGQFVAPAEARDAELHAVEELIASRAMAEKIVGNEDKSNPLSDEDLVTKLAESGYPVARRTVTKYRKMLNIHSSRQRKVWSNEK